MKNTLVVCSSNRLTERHTSSCFKQLVAAGAGLVEQIGTSDVALARNLALTMAHSLLSSCRYDMVLMVDDDMVFKVADAQALVDYAREFGIPASGAYVLPDGRLAAEPLEPRSGEAARGWVTGLGFLAIPAPELKLLAERSRTFKQRPGASDLIIEFTKSCSELAADGQRYWVPEDYRLTQNLGGVALRPIPVGHVKKQVLMPTESQIKETIR